MSLISQSFGSKRVNEGKEMKRLENILFGSLYSPIEFGSKEEEDTVDEADNRSGLFFVDCSVYKEDSETNEESDVEEETEQRKTVWVDEEEEEERTTVNIAQTNRLRKLRKEDQEESLITGREYVARLRALHAKMNCGTEWARFGLKSKLSGGYEDTSDEENGIVAAHGYEDVEGFDDVFRANGDLVVKSKSKLLPELLEYSRLVDANVQDASNGPINSVPSECSVATYCWIRSEIEIFSNRWQAEYKNTKCLHR